MANPDIDLRQLLPQGATLQGGKYRVVRYLSSGNFGNTYIVENTGMQVRFAMKEFFLRNICYRTGGVGISVSPAVDPEKIEIQREKFKKEAQRLYGLKSSHLVHVHDMFEENSTVYYVMDFVKGESLSDYMSRQGHPLTEEQTLYILDQLLDGLEEVHSKQIWHLDLKPDNVMIDREGNVVIIDFGASKQVGQSGRYTGTSNILCYTPGYAPTEQVNQNMDAIGPWTDIYALGATLYNLLTGIDPVTVSPSTLQFPQGVSRKTQQLIRAMMEPERSRRPQSIAAIRQLLSSPTSSSGPSHKWYAIAGVAFGIVAVGILLFNLLSGGGTEAPDIADDVWMEDSIVADEGIIVEDTAAVEEETMPSVPALPRTAEITLKVDSDADIYIDNERKGRRTWKGTLPAGSYRVECRQANCRTTTETLVVEAGRSRTVTLSAPTPLTGKLSVKSDPSGATVLIDGKERGTTPLLVPDLATGSHALTLRRDGYAETKQTVTVKEDATTETNLTLKAKPAETPTAGNTVATQSNSSSASNNGTFTVNGVTFKMVRVEGGTFRMGSSDSEADSDEQPVHSVTLSGYYIGETEVTQALWEAVMGNNPSRFKGANLPVEQVSWNDCQDFIRELNRLTGKRFRLPTEAEWEFAARGGNRSTGAKYSGSNAIANVAWYTDNSGSKTHPVKGKTPNELGLYDMSGNVWEWCQDWYGSYSSGSQTNPTGPSSGSSRVIRGGSWYRDARYCRVAYRGRYTPAYRLNFLGVRLAL